jgi:hypothetical protein
MIAPRSDRAGDENDADRVAVRSRALVSIQIVVTEKIVASGPLAVDMPITN